MKLKIPRADYTSLIKYALLFFMFLIFSYIEKEASVYSLAFFAAALTVFPNFIVTTILFIGSFAVTGAFGLISSMAIAAAFLFVLVLIYKKCKVKIRYELLGYVAISLLGYILLGSTSTDIVIEKRLLTSLFTVALTLVLQVALNAAVNKGLKYKLGYEEFASIFIAVALMGLGTSNFISPEVWKGVSVFIILIAAYLFRTGISVIFACVLGLGLGIYYLRLDIVALFLVWSLAAESFMKLSRFISAPTLVLSDYLMQVIFGIYPEYGVIQLVSIVSGAVLFMVFPTKYLKTLKEKLYSFREKQLVRQTINRNRLMTGNRLYELSNVFTEMKAAFKTFSKSEMTEEKIKSVLKTQILSSVCKNCDGKLKCAEYSSYTKENIDKLLNIGLAKGKISLIDLPAKLSECCTHPNNLIFSTNKMLSEFKELNAEKANFSGSRELLAEEAGGISEILKELALETSTTLKYQSRMERALADSLFKAGYIVSELLIYGEAENLSVGLILIVNEFSPAAVEKAVSDCLRQKMCLCEKADITEDKCYLSFRRSPAFDAAFGIACELKDGSDESGDTHSVTRIKEDRFLMALSDGMGSGEKAESISACSLSLIESFYKAGLNSPLILNTVNKLLAINSEDNFAALDISVINLKTCEADFIKYGSPYGFIISETGLRIIEGNTLPIGILEEISPSVCHAKLNDGDIILLVSDGVSDAFGSSSEIIDYLRSVPALNPQVLADGVVKKAVELSGGKKNDDMTALAVRLFRTDTAC